MPENLIILFFISIVISLALVLIHMLGHLISSKILKAGLVETTYGIGPKLFSFFKTRLLFRIPIIYCEEHVFEISTKPTCSGSNINQVFRRFLVIASGPFISFTIAICIFAYIGSMGSSILLPIVGEIRTESPADKAGLKPGDRILSVDMQETHSWDELAKLIANTTKVTLPLQIKRNDKIFTIIVEPEIRVTKDILGESFSRPIIGVSCAGKLEINKPTIWQLPKIGLVETGRLLEGNINDLISIFSSSHKKDVIAGPTQVMALTTHKQSFFVFILYYIASSTVTIALFSLLPLPIFDGGQFVYLVIESARGKQISLNVKKRLRFLSILILVALFVYAIALDLMYFL